MLARGGRTVPPVGVECSPQTRQAFSSDTPRTIRLGSTLQPHENAARSTHENLQGRDVRYHRRYEAKDRDERGDRDGDGGKAEMEMKGRTAMETKGRTGTGMGRKTEMEMKNVD